MIGGFFITGDCFTGRTGGGSFCGGRGPVCFGFSGVGVGVGVDFGKGVGSTNWAGPGVGVACILGVGSMVLVGVGVMLFIPTLFESGGGEDRNQVITA